jgi:hypothetical protein
VSLPISSGITFDVMAQRQYNFKIFYKGYDGHNALTNIHADTLLDALRQFFLSHDGVKREDIINITQTSLSQEGE